MIRLVPTETPEALDIDTATDAAKSAYGRARAAQRKLVGNLELAELLHRPGKVSYARLRGELHAAKEQAERAQAVVVALTEAVESLEATGPAAAEQRRRMRERAARRAATTEEPTR